MPTIHVKQIDTKLFGVVESENPEPFFSQFSNEQNHFKQLNLDDRAFDLLANGMGEDLESDSDNLYRYVKGEYREAAAAPSGNRLGTILEGISYLLLRFQGYAVTRIIGHAEGDAEHAFPTPDFFLEKDGLTGCAETKATIALDFLALKDIEQDPRRQRSWLAPCNKVESRRRDALRQLGYLGAVAMEQKHLLKPLAGGTVRFPTDFGVAHVHLVRDGRLDALSKSSKLRTPPTCRLQNRNCWNCLRSGDLPAHVTTVAMRNAPGLLGLPGSRGRGASWRKAYAYWTQAIWAREPVAVLEAEQMLVSATEAWLDEISDSSSAELQAETRGAWDRYLGALAFKRGLREVSVRQRFAGIREESRFQQRNPRQDDEPDVEEIAEPSADLLEREVDARFRWGQREVGSFTAYINNESVEIRSLSSYWWQRKKLDSDEEAKDIAIELMRALFRLQGVDEELVFEIDGLEAVFVFDAEVAGLRIGWRFASKGNTDSVRITYQPDIFWLDAPWLTSLMLGDPRSALFVHPDGRGYLRVPRQLVQRRGIYVTPKDPFFTIVRSP